MRRTPKTTQPKPAVEAGTVILFGGYVFRPVGPLAEQLRGYCEAVILGMGKPKRK